uniref:Uncharacterized protein n=1 Tax=Romanomermis culicivorax TaxID=13658 RepID=A0A915KBD4_ROMCU
MPITTLPDFDPKDDVVNHACMSKSIIYEEKPPLRGEHRPNWAIWGEYLYLPPQRWLHNLEHGGIIGLYHPCADMEQISILKEVVTDCLYRHIITPYNKLTAERPFALLSWGSKLEMNYINKTLAEQFIKDRAKYKAPEDIPDDGQFSENLVKRAELVSGDSEDNILCPYSI